MKIGIRKPNLKKSFKARNTARAKRALKSSINTAYDKRGAGWIKNPKRAAYNKIYNKFTFSISDLFK